jgi:hypothetical protein
MDLNTEYMAASNKTGEGNYTPAQAGASLFSYYVYNRCNDRKSKWIER